MGLIILMGEVKIVDTILQHVRSKNHPPRVIWVPETSGRHVERNIKHLRLIDKIDVLLFKMITCRLRQVIGRARLLLTSEGVEGLDRWETQSSPQERKWQGMPQKALRLQDDVQKNHGYADCMEQSQHPGTMHVYTIYSYLRLVARTSTQFWCPWPLGLAAHLGHTLWQM